MKRVFSLWKIIVPVLFIAALGGPPSRAQSSPPFHAFSAGASPADAKRTVLPADRGQTGEISEWEARWELARLLSYVQQYGPSIKEYEKVLDARPELLEARLEMARVHLWNAEKEEAAKIVQNLPQEPTDVGAKLLLADIYTLLKEYDKAVSLYEGHLEEHADDFQILLKLAEILSWTGRYEASLRCFQTVLKAHPDDIQARRKYALTLSWAGRRNEAIRQLRQTLDP